MMKIFFCLVCRVGIVDRISSLVEISSRIRFSGLLVKVDSLFCDSSMVWCRFFLIRWLRIKFSSRGVGLKFILISR